MTDQNDLAAYKAPALPAVVTSPELEQQVNVVLVNATEFVRDIEAKRKRLTEPYRLKVEEINAAAKAMKADGQAAIDACNKLLSDWRLTDTFKKLEMERNRASFEVQQAVLAGDINDLAEKGEEFKAANAMAPKSVNTEGGSTSFRTNYIIDGIDMAKLPEKYVIRSANETLIKKDLKSGDIKGVVYHVEKKAVVRQQ